MTEVNMIMLNYDDATEDEKLMVIRALIAVIKDYEESIDALADLVKSMDRYIPGAVLPEDLQERWDWLVDDVKDWEVNRSEWENELL